MKSKISKFIIKSVFISVCSLLAFIAASDVVNGSLWHIVPVIGMQLAVCCFSVE